MPVLVSMPLTVFAYLADLTDDPRVPCAILNPNSTLIAAA